MKEKDSLLVKATISAENGSFNFQNIPNVHYMISTVRLTYTRSFGNEKVKAKGDYDTRVEQTIGLTKSETLVVPA
ncbi:MAG: hypothetical protein C5B59_20160 [Bacteroidetes bacterium]|nr:MAG: hypothetical protein C5B59_20160 [Bacteroidota bacterium]